MAAYTGCNYFCFNIKVTVFAIVAVISTKTMDHCTECQSDDIDYATRVIGYLKKVTNFSKDRQKEEKKKILQEC